MTLYEALAPNDEARSKDGTVLVIRRIGRNGNNVYRMYRNGRDAGRFVNLMQVLAAANVDTLGWEPEE